MAEGNEGFESAGSPEHSLVTLQNDIFFKSVFNFAMATRFGPLWWTLMSRPPMSRDQGGVK
ncbi:hypothetical protein EPO14_02355 [Patescibacteria group bacterium]|nr:MAG: hypothetical protein EPO14_02355 [Patescibacteria group bacterium]